MIVLADELRQIYDTEPEIALMLDTFNEIERVYQEALVAMGVVSTCTSEVKNSAEVVISFRQKASTSGLTTG